MPHLQCRRWTLCPCYRNFSRTAQLLDKYAAVCQNEAECKQAKSKREKPNERHFSDLARLGRQQARALAGASGRGSLTEAGQDSPLSRRCRSRRPRTPTPGWRRCTRRWRRSPPTPTLTVLAHSLGAINWMRHAAMPQERPPARRPTGCCWSRRPTSSRKSRRSTRRRARRLLPAAARQGGHRRAGPRNSPGRLRHRRLCDVRPVGGVCRRLGIPIHKLPGAGISRPYYGYGEWPWVLDWCLRRATLPPQPNK